MAATNQYDGRAKEDVAPLRWLAFTSDPSPVQCSGGIFSGGMFGRRLPLAFYLSCALAPTFRRTRPLTSRRNMTS